MKVVQTGVGRIAAAQSIGTNAFAPHLEPTHTTKGTFYGLPFFKKKRAAAFSIPAYASIDQNFDIAWGDGRAKILNSGELLTLSLDKASGSGFRSKNEYLFGKIDTQLKLVHGNSAGTVTAYYVSLNTTRSARVHLDYDRIQLECASPTLICLRLQASAVPNMLLLFVVASLIRWTACVAAIVARIDMGRDRLRIPGQPQRDPYILRTNVFAQGKGNREQQFYLWFDPTADFHTYSILWNPQHIIFSVDGTPIRIFKNLQSKGVAFPKNQPMRIYSSLWNADDWATRGGLVKTDWSQAPFTASYRNFNADACVWSSGRSSCDSNAQSQNSWFGQELDSAGEEKIRQAQEQYMIYDYCTDSKRFPQGFPPECSNTQQN
ncbi:hypothetical protein ACLOJK_027705 [Asimina triloba]